MRRQLVWREVRGEPPAWRRSEKMTRLVWSIAVDRRSPGWTVSKADGGVRRERAEWARIYPNGNRAGTASGLRKRRVQGAARSEQGAEAAATALQNRRRLQAAVGEGAALQREQSDRGRRVAEGGWGCPRGCEEDAQVDAEERAKGRKKTQANASGSRSG